MAKYKIAARRAALLTTPESIVAILKAGRAMGSTDPIRITGIIKAGIPTFKMYSSGRFLRPNVELVFMNVSAGERIF